jgi:hypothetical protein
MRYKAAWAGALMCVLLLGCGSDPVSVSAPDDIVNHTGTVRQVYGLSYAIVDDVEPNELFAPTNLPESFKTDGARVLFSGKRGEIPPNVRMWGVPLELTSIQADIR